jgi:hypothetical protein
MAFDPERIKNEVESISKSGVAALPSPATARVIAADALIVVLAPLMTLTRPTVCA